MVEAFLVLDRCAFALLKNLLAALLVFASTLSMPGFVAASGKMPSAHFKQVLVAGYEGLLDGVFDICYDYTTHHQVFERSYIMNT